MQMVNKETLWDGNEVQLFEYIDNSGRTAVTLHARQLNFKKERQRTQEKGTILTRGVKFSLCTLDLDDSFEALSLLHSLLKVFEHRQFGSGQKKMVVAIPESAGQKNMRMFCRVKAYQKTYEGLELGYIDDTWGKESHYSQTFHIGYVHHLRNALHRAMGWLTPEPDIETAELVEDPKPAPAPLPTFPPHMRFSENQSLRFMMDPDSYD